MANFSERLRELRKANNLGQKEVGAWIGVSDSSIRKYESGDRTPTPDALKTLANFFDVSVDYLLGNDIEETENTISDYVFTVIGTRIKELRIENSLTQKELADFLNLTPKMISFYELGQRTPPSDIIIKLSEKFGVSTDYLLGKTNFRNHTETIALHRVGDPKDDLPQEALDKIEEFKELMRLKYQKKPTSK